MKKKILLIGSELGKGGAERSISLLSYYLDQDYDVTLCILSGKDRSKYYKTCKEVVFIDPPDSNTLYGKITGWTFRLKELRKLKKDRKIDVSISFLEGPDYANILTKGKGKIILSIRGSKVHDKMIKGTGGLIRKDILIPFLYRHAEQIVCVTQALCEEMEKEFGIKGNRLQTIYNFYETQEILKQASEPLNNEEEKIFSKKVIINSGRLHAQKEHDKLLSLVALVKPHEDIRAIILGDGDLKKDLIALAEQKGLTVCDWAESQKFIEADIYFMGFQSNAFKFYTRSQLFALTSSWEGFPNVLAEALICKIPVVTTDCYTGPREILDVKNLLPEPVTKAERTPVGSLLPLLNTPDAATERIWVEEILYWLSAERSGSDEYHKLTDRLAVDSLIAQWKTVIEKTA